ncbi:hypothetical protein GCM10020221_34430 [Streptomyces thioluteus]|uniref:Uncharacterized protein n=1 Tax=Streptomyces thioluteus TaxID=66431 RepID=A0ABP6JLX4_STRTU
MAIWKNQKWFSRSMPSYVLAYSPKNASGGTSLTTTRDQRPGSVCAAPQAVAAPPVVADEHGVPVAAQLLVQSVRVGHEIGQTHAAVGRQGGGGEAANVRGDGTVTGRGERRYQMPVGGFPGFRETVEQERERALALLHIGDVHAIGDNVPVLHVNSLPVSLALFPSRFPPGLLQVRSSAGKPQVPTLL